jgi:LacI family transcriptional regulator
MAEKRPKKLSVHDIAALSGVSAATVSRVINGYEHVSDKTRQRVLEVIERYDYQPNTVAQALARQSSRVIGILVPELVSEVFADPFFANLIQSITYSANHLDYDVTLWLTSTEDNSRVFNRVLNDSLSDGLIIAETSINPMVTELLDRKKKPYMLIGRPIGRGKAVNFVDSENLQGAYMMTQYLIEQGYQRIGIIPGREDLPSAIDRIAGYREAIEEAGLPEIIAPSGRYTKNGGYKSMVYLLQQDVDAVFCSSDLMSVGAIQAIHEAGLNVPDDIAIGSFDDMPNVQDIQPALTTIRQNLPAVAQMAVEGLVGILEGEIETPFRQVLPVEIVIRESA